MTVDNRPAPDPDTRARPAAAGSGEGSKATPQKGPPRTAAKKKVGALELPNGCSLSEEVEIPVGDLVITQRRDEGERGEVRLHNLGQSMKLVGQLYELIVRYDEATQKYHVLAGNRRTEAARRVEIPTLRCRIFTGPDRALPHVISAIENAHREQEPPWSLALKLRAGLDAGYDQRQLAEMFQKSKGAVSDLLYAVLKLPRALQKRIEQGENLFRVVAEHRKARKGAGTKQAEAAPAPSASTPEGRTERPAAANPQVAPPPAATEPLPTTEPAAGEPATAAVAKPPSRFNHGRFEHGALTVTVTGTSKETPPTAEVVAALRHALAVVQSAARGEEK